MELEKSLNEYLEKVEKYLRPMALSERVDIVKEIKSEMLELQAEGISAEQIAARLGDPRELARAYLGDSIAKGRGFGWRRVSMLIAFYGLAGIGWMIVLPITSISGIAFMLTGILCPVLGVVKLVAHLMGYELDAIGMSFGSYSAGPVAFLPLSVLLGAVVFLVGWLLWKLTVFIVKSMSKGKKKLDA